MSDLSLRFLHTCNEFFAIALNERWTELKIAIELFWLVLCVRIGSSVICSFHIFRYSLSIWPDIDRMEIHHFFDALEVSTVATATTLPCRGIAIMKRQRNEGKMQKKTHQNTAQAIAWKNHFICRMIEAEHMQAFVCMCACAVSMWLRSSMNK